MVYSVIFNFCLGSVLVTKTLTSKTLGASHGDWETNTAAFSWNTLLEA